MRADRARRPSPTVPLTAIAALVAAAAIAGCGCSSEETSSTATGGPAGSATTLTAPSGVRTKACVDQSLDQPEIVVIGTSCAEARRVVSAWEGRDACAVLDGASHSACSLGKLRCFGTVTDRGLAVNCSRAGRSISFVEPT